MTHLRQGFPLRQGYGGQVGGQAEPITPSVRVSWSAPPPYADATMIALQAMAEAGARAFIATVLRPAMLVLAAERDAAEASRWADDGGRL